jgi:hypothetical protein
MEEFPDVKPFPVKGAPLEQFHNEPPLADRLTMQFEDALARKGLPSRVAEITTAAARAPDPIANEEDAGAVGDLLKQAKAAHQAIKAEREILNRPLLDAQRAMIGKADALTAPMDKATGPLKDQLDAFMARAGEAVHGDMGTRVGTRADWNFEIVDFARLPLAIRRHPDVIAAMERVIRGLIKGGAREIPGVLIKEGKHAVIR